MTIQYRICCDCVPSEKAQRLLAPCFIERVKVLDLVSPLSIVGILGSGEALAEEIARLVGKTAHTLPLVSIRIPALGEDIAVAATGMHEIGMLNPVLVPTCDDRLQAKIASIKDHLFQDARHRDACFEWEKSIATVSQTTVLLIDSVMTSKSKFEGTLRTLLHDRCTKIIPLAALIHNPVLLGNRIPLKGGVFLKRMESIDEIRLMIDQIEISNERELKKMFPAL